MQQKGISRRVFPLKKTSRKSHSRPLLTFHQPRLRYLVAGETGSCKRLAGYMGLQNAVGILVLKRKGRELVACASYWHMKTLRKKLSRLDLLLRICSDFKNLHFENETAKNRYLQMKCLSSSTGFSLQGRHLRELCLSECSQLRERIAACLSACIVVMFQREESLKCRKHKHVGLDSSHSSHFQSHQNLLHLRRGKNY